MYETTWKAASELLDGNLMMVSKACRWTNMVNCRPVYITSARDATCRLCITLVQFVAEKKDSSRGQDTEGQRNRLPQPECARD